MRATRYELIDPVFSEEQADAIVRLCERYGSYGTYAQKQIDEDFGNGLFQRHDVGMNFLETGGHILIADLRERGRLGEVVPNGRELALLMIDEYVHFPPTATAAAA
jgi:hypothetical protein